MLKFDALTPLISVVRLDIDEDKYKEILDALEAKETSGVPLQIINTNNPEIVTLDAEIAVVDKDEGFATLLEGFDKIEPEAHALLSSFSMEELMDKIVDEVTNDLKGGEVELIELAVGAYFVIDMGEEAFLQTNYMAFASYAEDSDDENESIMHYFGIMIHNPQGLTLDNETRVVSFDEQSQTDSLVDFSAKFALFALGIKDVELSVVQVFGYAFAEESEKISFYEQFIAIRDNLFFHDKSNASAIYQGLLRHHPQITIADVTNFLSSASVPMLDTVSVTIPDDNAIDVEEYVATAILQEIVEDGAVVSNEAVEDAAFNHLGLIFLGDDSLGIENLDSDLAELRKGPISPDGGMLAVGDMSLNRDFPGWVLTLLIPFVRVQMNKYPDIGSEGINYNMVGEFIEYLEKV